MNCFLGPLGHNKNYIQDIALDNCIDYYDLIKKNESKKKLATSDKSKELRYFLNAAESLNNILEYMYIDSLDKIEEYKTEDLNKLKNDYYKKYSFLEELSDISNAYKHRLRFRRGNKLNNSKIHAKDLMSNKLSVDINFEHENGLCKGVIASTKYLYENNYNPDLINKAFKYWIDYINKS